MYARCLIHKSTIAPHFDYCATLIINVRETLLSMLRKEQDSEIGIILNCDKRAKIERMLQALHFMSIKQKLYYSICVFIYNL